MDEAQIQQIMAEQDQQRQTVLLEYTPAKAAYELARMAIEHGGSGAEAAAKLLLAMEHQRPFDFTLLLAFDTCNRAKADMLMMNYRAHEIWPSRWMDAADYFGKAMMKSVNEKWGGK